MSSTNNNPSQIIVEVESELKDLIPNFLKNREKEIANIIESIKTKNYTELTRIGHSMKGSCGGYGFYILSELGKKIEEAAKSQNEKSLSNLIEEYKSIIKRIFIVYKS